MQRPDHELQKRAFTFKSPTFGYRRGEDGEIEKDIFDGEPLPVGWVDSPADVDGPLAPAIVLGSHPPPKITIRPAGASLAMPYEDHNYKILRAEYGRRTDKKVPLGVSKVSLIGMLSDLDAGE